MAPQKKPIEERLWNRINKGSSCWLWLGPLDARGYGAIGEGGRGGRVLKVHALVYRLLIGPTLPGTELHHKCHNKACCNPEHIEPLTKREHLSRHLRKFKGGSKRHSHCKHGHPFDEANTYMWKGQRTCRVCNLRHTHNRRHNPKPCPPKPLSH